MAADLDHTIATLCDEGSVRMVSIEGGQERWLMSARFLEDAS
jgi:hypothetical protein